MKMTVNPELESAVLKWIDKKYKLSQSRDGLHLSTLLGCLTKSYLDQCGPIELSKKEVLYFSTGFGLQEVMGPEKQETIHIYEGITFRPDFELDELNGRSDTNGEMKSTRKRANSIQEEDGSDLPVGWVRYMMGVCKAKGNQHYDLAIIHLIEPDLKCWSCEFTQEEIDTNWEWIVQRKQAWDAFQKSKAVPTPFAYAEEWECKSCRYKIVCDGLSYANKVVSK